MFSTNFIIFANMKHVITNMDRLKFARKAMRETTHRVKPMITKDKKKEQDKRSCRKFKW